MDVCDLMETHPGIAEGFPCDLRRYTLAFDGWNNFHVACGGTWHELKRSILDGMSSTVMRLVSGILSELLRIYDHRYTL